MKNKRTYTLILCITLTVLLALFSFYTSYRNTEFQKYSISSASNITALNTRSTNSSLILACKIAPMEIVANQSQFLEIQNLVRFERVSQFYKTGRSIILAIASLLFLLAAIFNFISMQYTHKICTGKSLMHRIVHFIHLQDGKKQIFSY